MANTTTPTCGSGLIGRLRFIVWFTYRDLTDRAARSLTLLILLTVAAAAAFALSAHGLAEGAQAVETIKIREDPLRLCVWAGWARLPGRIDGTKLAKLDAALEARLGPPPPGSPRTRSFLVSEAFWTPSQGLPIRFRGRSVAPGDPILASLHDRNGLPGFSLASWDAQTPGLCVTQEMLKRSRLSR